MKVELKETTTEKGDKRPPSVTRIANGNYRRSFDPAQQPFEVTDEEWAALEPTGLFREASEAAAGESDTDGSTGGEGGGQTENVETKTRKSQRGGK